MNLERVQISQEEALELGAVDSSFYAAYFFPKAARMTPPSYAPQLWDALENPSYRYVSAEIYRDGAKTTTCRLFASKRIAYAVSHSIVYTSNSERHATRSIDWLARQVEHNTLWTSTFGLRKGGKWSEAEIEIIHGVDEFPIRVIAVGITGQVRGINFDDYRPDLIVADDLDNEETTGTPEQREKANNLFFGALIQGLAQATDIPDAKAINLATPLAHGDIIETCRFDPTWHSLTFGCFDEGGNSRWPAKFPTATLLAEKQAYIQRGQLALWMREKECKIVSEELAAFRLAWLKEWHTIPEDAWYFVAIDPARSDAKTADEFAMVLFAVWRQHVFIVEVFAARGVEPDRAMAQFWAWRREHFLRYVVIESVAYQQMLAWYFKKSMEEQRIWVAVVEYDDRRRKDDRILQNILAYGPQGHLHYSPKMLGVEKFLAQYQEWRPGAKIHDDVLDALGMGLASLKGRVQDLEAEFRRIEEEERDLEPIKRKSLCP